MPRTLLAVHAHPDDESITTGGTLARYAAEGVRTVVATWTGGDVGEIRDTTLADSETLSAVRARELAEACHILRVARSVLFGYRDSGMRGWAANKHPESLLQADFEEAVGKLVHLIREERPQVVLTYDEQGNYGHPDHVRSHELTVAACSAAANPRRFLDAGPAWPVAGLYFVVFGRSAVARFNRALARAGIAAPVSALSGADAGPDAPPFGVDDARITHAVDVSSYLDVRRRALAAHATQMAGHWLLQMPTELAREVWSEETYQRADLAAGGRHGPVREDLSFDS